MPPHNLELWFHKPAMGGAILRLRVNPKNHDKRVTFVDELALTLEKAIPFKYETVSGPEVHILGGQRRPGVITVQVVIKFDHIIAEAGRQLKEAGFQEGTDPLVG